MTESIEDLLVNGYGVWRKNLLALGLPHLLNSIVSFIVLIAGALLVGAVILLPLMSQITGGGFDSASFISLLTSSILPLLVILALVAFFLILLISSFFTAGAIGMAMKAIETGRTSIDDMMGYGKKKFLSLFFAEVLILLMMILGSLFLIPAVIAFLSGSLNIGLSLLILGLTVFILYLTVLGVVLLVVPYAIVVGDLGPTEGIEKGYNVFMGNKLSIIFLWFILTALSVGCDLIQKVIVSFISILPYIGPFIALGLWCLYLIFWVMVIAPLSTVWWTRLYMDKTTGLKTGSSPPEAQPQSREPPYPQPEIYI